MLFNSWSFVVFFPLVAILYMLVPKSWRWFLMLAASCYFYMSFIPAYILILFALITIDYVLGIRIENAQGRTRKLLLLGSIIANLGTLFIFKYFNFANANVSNLAHFLGWNYPIGMLRLVLPLGLSYHIFQSLSYVIEVYFGHYPAERHYGYYALYVMYFPQLVAGPIEKPQQLLPQLHDLRDVKKENARYGLELMAWGFFKKVIVADNIGFFVDAVHANLHASSGPALLAAMVLFAIQLYADFSGYSDIAVGASQFFGVTLINNFNFPFYSRSVAELWRRWHISLSNWARDYVYFPLAVSWARIGRRAVYFAVLVTFVLIGLWHGAGWNFAIMGLVFGGSIVLGTITKPWRDAVTRALRLPDVPSLHAAIQTIITFFINAVGWVFFRSQSAGDAFYFLGHLFGGWRNFPTTGFVAPTAMPQPAFTIALLATASMMLIDFLEFRWALFTKLKEKHPRFRWITYYGYALIFLIFALGVGTYEQKAFIYFQF